jgi:hypothetical protein
MKKTRNLVIAMKVRNLMIAILTVAISIVGTHSASAQEIVVPQGYELVDSLVYRHVSGVDTLLAGKDIFHIMPLKAKGGNADVEIYQSQEVANALRKQIQDNSKRTMNGYRVRIFFDNKQTARAESEETIKRFEDIYHDVKAYRTYANPYFKVTVGDFRTKSEAMELLSRIKREFPSAFVVKENIEFPVVDKDNAYIVDTIKVLRPIASIQ